MPGGSGRLAAQVLSAICDEVLCMRALARAGEHPEGAVFAFDEHVLVPVRDWGTAPRPGVAKVAPFVCRDEAPGRRGAGPVRGRQSGLNGPKPGLWLSERGKQPFPVLASTVGLLSITPCQMRRGGDH